MPWRLIEVAEADARPDDLADSELVGVSVLLTHNAGEQDDRVRPALWNVYWRARQKIQPQVEKALLNDDVGRERQPSPIREDNDPFGRDDR